MSRIAVVGSGIAGLTTAWLLARAHDVVLLERDDRLGGHTHTHHLDTPDGPLALDTGFLVHNDRTYPRLIRLFDEIGVVRRDSDMSFGVFAPDEDFEYSTRDLNGLFASRTNLIRPGHYALLVEILRFNRVARRLARKVREAPPSDIDARLTLGDLLDQHGFGGAFVRRYLAPLAAAIWSSSPDAIQEFPALTLVRFFDQHGMITTLDHPTWKVVDGGSASYIPRLLASPRIEVRHPVTITAIHRRERHVEIAMTGQPLLEVDQVVLACHGDHVLPLLADASAVEREVFAAFHTSANEAVLHTDAAWLPRRLAARAAWNYRLGPGGSGAATVTYHLNRLQGFTARQEYCVTLNPTTPIAPERVLRRMSYTHPLYTLDAVRAQARWAEVSGMRRTHYAGAYWFYGFHEDGVRSGVRVAEALGVAW